MKTIGISITFGANPPDTAVVDLIEPNDERTGVTVRRVALVELGAEALLAVMRAVEKIED